MEVLEDLDEDSKPSDPVREALEDPDVGNKLRGPVTEALEDPDQGNEVNSSYDHKKTVSFRCQREK